MSGATLYRYYDADGALLYVGVSKRALYRLTQHQAEKPWHLEIATVKMEHLADRAAALEAEAVAIRDENPRYNKTRLLARDDVPLEVTLARMELYAAIGRQPLPPKPRTGVWRPTWEAARVVVAALAAGSEEARQ